MNKVITYDGSSADKEVCRRIRDDWYIIGNPSIKDSGQCFELYCKAKDKKQFYRINSPKLEWDYEANHYIILEEANVIHGYVGKNKNGYFSKNIYENIPVREICPMIDGPANAARSEIMCLNESVAQMNSYFQSKLDGYHYNVNNSVSTRAHESIKNFYGKIPYEGIKDAYSISTSNVLGKITDAFNNFDLKVGQSAQKFHELLDGLSFGYECENSAGRIPEKYLYQFGVIPLKDGSTPNHELTSIPYDSSKGVQAFFDAFELYNNLLSVNQDCSLHFHIGNVFKETTSNDFKLDMIAIYMLYYHLQNEIWEIIPPYKRSNDYFKNKKGFKDHCQPLRSLGLFNNTIYSNQDGSASVRELTKDFKTLFRFLNDGIPMGRSHNLETRVHSKQGGNKWDIDSRYYALNLYNAVFGDSKTVEFRAYSATANPYKAVANLLLSTGIIRFALKHREAIIKHDTKYHLNDIALEFADNFGKRHSDMRYCESVSEMLLQYIRERKDTFNEAFFNHDIYASEFAKDRTYTLSRKIF